MGLTCELRSAQTTRWTPREPLIPSDLFQEAPKWMRKALGSLAGSANPSAASWGWGAPLLGVHTSV